jgi:RNA polymerase sigma factor (sigma-70 family)
MKVVSIFSKRQEYNLEQIIAGCQQQQEHFQRLLFNRCAPKLLTTCRRYENYHLDAREIMHDTFITVFEKINQYDSEKGSIDTWMNRIAINTALKSLRKKPMHWEDVDLVPDVPDEPENDNNTLQDLTEEQIMAVIEELPVGYRTVFNLFVIDGFSHQEIADQLDISTQTSKSQLFKAKAMLRNKFTPKKKMANGI